MSEDKNSPLWKIVLVSGIVSAVSTLGMYYMENPEKLSNTKKYFLKKLGYDAENLSRIKSDGLSDNEISEIIKREVSREIRKYFPNA